MTTQPEPFDLRSQDIAEDRRQELLRLSPEIRTEGGQIDFERLKLALGQAVDVGKERYGLTWPPTTLAELTNQVQDALLKGISARNARFFEDELKKLDAWADDQLASAEKALKDVKKRIRDLRNAASKAADLVEQARIQSEISDLERRQRKLRQEIFDVEDRILAQRDQLVAAIRGKLHQSIQQQTLFTIRWSLQGQP